MQFNNTPWRIDLDAVETWHNGKVRNSEARPIVTVYVAQEEKLPPEIDAGGVKTTVTRLVPIPQAYELLRAIEKLPDLIDIAQLITQGLDHNNDNAEELLRDRAQQILAYIAGAPRVLVTAAGGGSDAGNH